MLYSLSYIPSDLRLDGAFSAASLAPQLPLAEEECPDSAAALLAWEALQSAAGQQRPQPPWFEPECLRCDRVVMFAPDVMNFLDVFCLVHKRGSVLVIGHGWTT